MFESLLHNYKQLNYINQCFEDLFLDAIEERLSSFRQHTVTLKTYLKEAYLNQDATLIVCIIHHQLLLQYALSDRNQLTFCSELFDLNSKELLTLKLMLQQRNEVFLVHYLIEQTNPYAFQYITDKRARLPFKLHIFNLLAERINLTSDTSMLINVFVEAIEQKDFTKIEQLLHCFAIQLEIFFYRNDSQGYATFLYQFNTKLSLNSLSLTSEQQLLVSTLIMGILTHLPPIYNNAKQHYGFSYDDLLQFRRRIVESVADEFSMPFFLFKPLFKASKSLLHEAALSQKSMVFFELVTSCLMNEYIMLNHPEHLAEHIMDAFEALENKLFIPQINPLELNHLTHRDSYIQLKQQMIYQILSLLMQSCLNSGMDHEGALQFINCFADAIQRQLKSIMPESCDLIVKHRNIDNHFFACSPEIFINHFEIACDKPWEKIGILINQLHLNTVTQYFCIHQDAAGFIHWISRVKTLLLDNHHQERNMTLMKTLDLDPFTRRQLDVALTLNDTPKIISLMAHGIINSVSLRPWIFLSTYDLKKHVSSALNTKAFDPSHLFIYKQQNNQWMTRILERAKSNNDFYDDFLDYYRAHLSQNNWLLAQDLFEKMHLFRLRLYDLAFAKQNTALYCELLNIDLALLKQATTPDCRLKIADFLHLNSQALDKLNLNISDDTAWMLWLIMLIRLEESNIYLQRNWDKSTLWNFQVAAYKQLSAKSPMNYQVDSFCNEYETAIITENTKEIHRLEHLWTLILQDGVFCSQILPLSAKLIYFLIRLKKIFDENEHLRHIILQKLCGLTGNNIDIDVMSSLLLQTQLDLIYWHMLNTCLKPHYNNVDHYINPEILKIKSELYRSIEVLQTSQQSQSFAAHLLAIASNQPIQSRKGLLYSLDAFEAQTLNIKQLSFPELKLLRLELETFIEDRFYTLNGKEVACVLRTYLTYCKTLYQEGKKSELSALMLSSSLGTSSDNHNYFLKHDKLLEPIEYLEIIDAVFLCQELTNLIQNYSHISTGSSTEHALFFKTIYHEWRIDALLTREITIDLLQSSPTLFATVFSMLFNYTLHIKDNASCCALIKKLANIIRFVNKSHQSDILLPIFDMQKETLQQLLTFVLCDYQEGLYYVLVEYYVSQYAKSRLDPLFKSDICKKEMYASLGLDNNDLIILNPKQVVAKQEEVIYEATYKALRHVANRNIDITLFVPCNELAKSQAFHAILIQHPPKESDDACYHHFYEIMSLIWHMHVVTHVFAPLKTLYLVHPVEIDTQGASHGVLLHYLREAFINSHKTSAFLTRAYHSHFSSHTSSLDVESMIQDVTNALTKSIPTSKKSLLQQMTCTNSIIALPIKLQFEEGFHAVTAVFCGKNVILADRGNWHGFSGMTIYRFDETNTETLQNILITLYASAKKPLTEKDYKELQKQLNLTEIESIQLPSQMIGNCSFASQAEPIYLSILYFTFNKLALKTGSTCEAAHSLADYLAQEMVDLVKQELEQSLVESLTDFLNQSHANAHALKSLLAHVYLAALYRLKNDSVVSYINKGQWIHEPDLHRATTDLQFYFKRDLEQGLSLKAREQLNPMHLDKEASNLTNLYLNRTVDSSQFIKDWRRCLYRLSKTEQCYFTETSLISFFNQLTPSSLLDSVMKPHKPKSFRIGYVENLSLEGPSSNIK